MITERAMLAAVHISIWTAIKHDRKVSRQVANEHGAPERAGRYNKKLLSGAARLDDLRSLAGQIRQSFYKITLPWSDEGYRLLPAHFYFDWTQQMREFDFRVTMSAEEQTRVAKEIDTNVRQSLARGTEDLWSRLQDVVSHMVDRLNEPESRFHSSLVTNVLDLVALLPHLNVGEDRELNRFAEEIRNKLCGFTARDLKTNDVLRVATAHDAAALLYEMDAVLREREEKQETTQEMGSASSADHIFSHMSAYMEAVTQ